MTNLGCVHATLLVAIFYYSSLVYQLTLVSGCPGGRDVISGGGSPAGEAVAAGGGCPCGGGKSPANRYVNRTDVIKEEILRKLRMIKPPNATAQLRHLPDIPLLHSLIERANNENNNRKRSHNDNEYDDVDDDDHVAAVTIIALAQTGYLLFFLTLILTTLKDKKVV